MEIQSLIIDLLIGDISEKKMFYCIRNFKFACHKNIQVNLIQSSSKVKKTCLPW